MKKLFLGLIIIFGLTIIFFQPKVESGPAREQWQIEQDKAYLMGRFDPSQKPDFTPLPSSYSLMLNTVYIRKETLAAFNQMAAVAQNAGIELKITSATRNFDRQKEIWEEKWASFTDIPAGVERFRRILEYSAAPGTSRHHWGTDIDINSADPAYFESGRGEFEYKWLLANASSFGFCQTYTAKNLERPTGYNEEKWHWSYMPLSKSFTASYAELIYPEEIQGFVGEEYAKDLHLVRDYVLSINPECL